MAWNLKLKLLGRKINLEIDSSRPGVQKIYNFRIGRKWRGSEYCDRRLSRDFMIYALTHLPNGSFIVFSFDKSGYLFVQFANLNGNVVADFPLWDSNCYYDKEKEIVACLKSMDFRRRYWNKGVTQVFPPYYQAINQRSGKKAIIADFGKNYSLAAEATILIARKLLRIETPRIFNFSSARLKHTF